MKKIGDKSWILSPIMGFQIQKLFRKPSDSRTHDYLKQFVNEGVLEVKCCIDQEKDYESWRKVVTLWAEKEIRIV